ncbi:MAG: oligosaccharide flippase family protein [Candidatus Margulisiibacteriota bacterium]
MRELKLVAKGGVFSLFGDAVNYSLSYVFLFLASHFLGASLLGSYYWAIAIASLLGEFADLGTGQGLIYFSPKYEAEKGKDSSLPLLRFVLGFTLTNALIVGTLLFIFAPQVAAYFNKAELSWLIRLFAIAMPLSAFWPVVYKYCVGRFQITTGILYGDISRPIIRVFVLIAFIFMGQKAFALVGTEMIVGLVLFIVGVLIIIKLWGRGVFRQKLSWKEKKSVLLYSIPFLPLNLARGERMIIIITGLFLLSTQIGIFGVVLKIAALSQVILTGMNFVLRPMVSKLYAEKNMEALKGVYRSVTRWIFVLTLPLSYLFIFYSGPVLALFGEKFTAGAMALTIVAIGYLFEYGTSATQVIINMTGKSLLSLINQIIYLAIVVVLAFLLIPHYGIVGGAVAVAAGIVAINLLRLYQSYRIVGFTPYSWYLFKPLLAAAIAGLLVRMIPSCQILYVGISYLLAYAAAIIILRIDQEDRELLLGLRRKLFF